MSEDSEDKKKKAQEAMILEAERAAKRLSRDVGKTDQVMSKPCVRLTVEELRDVIARGWVLGAAHGYDLAVKDCRDTIDAWISTVGEMMNQIGGA